MLVNNLTIYNAWNLALTKIPSRSQLYCLEPVGVGTPDVESLTGYIARLAQAHCVPTGILILSHIAPLVIDGYVFDGKDKDLNACYCCANSRGLNQTGSRAINLVKALESVTKRNDLHCLTLVNFGEVLCDIGLLKATKAWCPICYEQWRALGQVVYEPLNWAFNLVTICPHHHQPLLQECPHCYKTIPFLTWLSRPGYCSKCLGWLGDSQQAETTKTLVLSQEQRTQQMWVIKNIGELLASQPYLSLPFSKECLKRTICAYVDNITSGNIKAFAEFIGQPPYSVQKWYRGERIPLLSNLLNICEKLSISLVDFLSGKVENVEFEQIKKTLFYKQDSRPKYPDRQTHDKHRIEQALITAMNEYPPPSLIELQQRLGLKCRTVFYKYFPVLSRNLSAWHIDYRRKVRYNRIQQALLSELDSNKYPPPTLAEIAKLIGVDLRALYKDFPEKCHILSARYIRYRHERARQRVEKIQADIRKAVFELDEQGINPNAYELSKVLNKPGIMRDPRACEAFEAALRELGYESRRD